MEYGKKISTLRRKNNLTQAELGEKLNVTPQAVSKWENNLSQPDIDSLRKMSALFKISLDEMLNDEENNEQNDESEQENKVEKNDKKDETLPILGYCKVCNKAVRAGEFKTTIDKNHTQNTYCNSCYDKLLKAKKEKEIRQAQFQQQMKIDESKKIFFKGIIWGVVGLVIALIGGLITYSQQPTTLYLLMTILLPIGLFTMISQIIWGNFVGDVFIFFCKSFKAPFGLIFELSLDGIIWLLTVKLALWIICGALSIAFFLLGIVVTSSLSLIVFPFTLPYSIKQMNNGELEGF